VLPGSGGAGEKNLASLEVFLKNFILKKKQNTPRI
jgi:hypothetical protein